MSGIYNGVSMTLLQKSLDAVWYRQQVISNNIANAETPGYKSKKVEFENLLYSAIDSAGRSEGEILNLITNLEPQLVESNLTSTKEDGNNVDADSENIELARAQLQYEYLTNALSSQISRLKYVINEGRG